MEFGEKTRQDGEKVGVARAAAGLDKPHPKVQYLNTVEDSRLAAEGGVVRFNAGDDTDMRRAESGGREDKDRRGSISKARPSVHHPKLHVSLHAQGSQHQSSSSSVPVKHRRNTRRFSLPKMAMPISHSYPHRSDFASTGADGLVEDEDATELIHNVVSAPSVHFSAKCSISSECVVVFSWTKVNQRPAL